MTTVNQTLFLPENGPLSWGQVMVTLEPVSTKICYQSSSMVKRVMLSPASNPRGRSPPLQRCVWCLDCKEFNIAPCFNLAEDRITNSIFLKSEVRVFWTTLLPSFCSVHFPKRLVQPKRMSLPRYYESCQISVRDRSSLAFAPWHLFWVHLHRNDLGLCHYLCRLCSHWCCPGLLLSIALQAGSSSSIFQRQE